MSEKTGILIVDDHMIVRQGLKLIFETEAEIEVMGEAENGQEGVELAKELQPDIILMDLQMPVMDGYTAVQQIMSARPESRIIILTTFNEDELMYQCLQAGAKGFLLKDTGRDALMNTIGAAMRGRPCSIPRSCRSCWPILRAARRMHPKPRTSSVSARWKSCGPQPRAGPTSRSLWTWASASGQSAPT